jgi:glycosyltransferase involved in cell wall biosynthesis
MGDFTLNVDSVLLDGFNLALEKGTGVATYARNLSFILHELGMRTEVLYGIRSAPKGAGLLREIAFFDSNVEPESRWLHQVRSVRATLTAGRGVTPFPVPITGAVVSRGFEARLPYFDKVWSSPNLFTRARNYFKYSNRLLSVNGAGNPGISHWTYPIPIRHSASKNIYTLHDLVPLRLPYTTLDNKKYYYNSIKAILDIADHIVTVSETSKKDIVSLFGYPEEKITNTYQSVEISRKYTDIEDTVIKSEIEGAFGLRHKEYLLFYGAIEPKKNVGRLIEAFLSSQVADVLVIVGAEAWKSEEELRFLTGGQKRSSERVTNEENASARIRRFDYVPFPLLVTLIRGAKAVMFPSLYEGFGLPILEGMLLGTPVVTSHEGATKEIAGDAALLVDPYDIRMLAAAIREISGNAELRANLTGKGRIRAEEFSPQRYRDRLSALYARL